MLTCGSCGKTATLRLNSGLPRCQECYEGCFIVCKWPRDPREFVKDPRGDIERPWRKWLPADNESEWYR